MLRLFGSRMKSVVIFRCCSLIYEVISFAFLLGPKGREFHMERQRTGFGSRMILRRGNSDYR